MRMGFDAIAFPRTVNGTKDYADPKSIYKKGTPIQTKAALLYNHHAGGNFRPIKDGDKIRFSYLKEPNRWHSPVIGVPDNGEIPYDWIKDLEAAMDRKVQFEKTFLNPLERLCAARGWTTKKRATLNAFRKLEERG